MAVESLVFDESSEIMSKMMELATERQRVIANNIANVNTEGYTRLELDFQKKIAEIVKSGDIQNLKGFEGKIVKDSSGTPKADGNNVQVSKEMNEMMENNVLYSLLSRAFKTRMNILKSAIS